MIKRIKTFIMAVVLVAYVLSMSGCAVGWFLVGAGTAATAIAVVNENEKEKAKD